MATDILKWLAVYKEQAPEYQEEKRHGWTEKRKTQKEIRMEGT